MALIGAGAKTPAGRIDGPPIVGVIAFSSAGSVPGLIGPDSFAAIDLPLLLVTGDADIVPGFVADWHDHRRAFDQSRPGNKTLIIVRGGNHEIVGKSDAAIFAAISGAAVDFANALAARQPAARRRLAGLHSTAAYSVEHR